MSDVNSQDSYFGSAAQYLGEIPSPNQRIIDGTGLYQEGGPEDAEQVAGKATENLDRVYEILSQADPELAEAHVKACRNLGRYALDQSLHINWALAGIDELYNDAVRSREVNQRLATSHTSGLLSRAAFFAAENGFFANMSRQMPSNRGPEAAETQESTGETELADNDRLVLAINLDLDKMKDINDTEGHAQGDKLLKNTGKIVAESFDVNTLSQHDPYAEVLPGHLGGDEFVILLSTTKRTLWEVYGIVATFDTDGLFLQLDDPTKLFKQKITRADPPLEEIQNSVGAIRQHLGNLISAPSISIGVSGLKQADFVHIRQLYGRGTAREAFDAVYDDADAKMFTDKNDPRRHLIGRGVLSGLVNKLTGSEQTPNLPERDPRIIRLLGLLSRTKK